MGTTAPPPVVRFATFELDLSAGELHKAGARVRLQDKPFRLLAALLERPGELVTREELSAGSGLRTPSSTSTTASTTRSTACAPRWATRPKTRGSSRRSVAMGIASSPPWRRCPRSPRLLPSVPGDGSHPGLAADGRRRPGFARAAARRGGRLAGLALPSAGRRPHPLPGRAPLRQPVFRCGAGVSGRRHHRRADHGAGGDPLAARPLAAIRASGTRTAPSPCPRSPGSWGSTGSWKARFSGAGAACGSAPRSSTVLEMSISGPGVSKGRPATCSRCRPRSPAPSPAASG